ncbi:hypothetical protein [Natrarchaeobaculum aegyptiacum]|uniref:DUF8108 domain-containing protein n=1 Tax=Natrarchaeobaculum aegyptiacum TaxID=745377 RepID=A0A2Z2I030_9EURY|nr:hypothetical protein [Natrarchaeobaculum aegyptiacum]ARS89448.1 hypothetical protein B1756_06610 [Natrarchaeobaculum aegyptiacum]
MSGPDRHSSVSAGLRRVADHAGFALLWCWILVSVLILPTWLGFWWLGVALFVLGLIVCWLAAGASSDPVYTIGTKREVRKGRVDDPRASCGECGRPAAGGEYRRYEERRVVFGSTIAVSESGLNVYCEECAVDPQDSYARVADDGGGREQDVDVERGSPLESLESERS